MPLKIQAISSRLCRSDVKTHAHSNKRLARGRGREEERREGGEEERRRGGEEERRRDLLLFTRVLSDCTCVLLAFTRVFKWYRLKPMQFQACYVIQMLKPMHTAIKEWREAG